MKRFALILAVLILSLTACASTPPTVSPKVQSYYDENVANAKPTLPPTNIGVTAAFLGDSYTAGTGTDHASKSFAAVASRTLGWQYQAFAKGGTGYTGPGGDSYIGRVDALIAAKPSLVVISGSRNDSGTPAAEIESLADELYSKIRTALPAAKIVVVGPLWPTSEVPEGIQELNRGIKAAATSNNLTFIDALNPSWMDGAPGTISSDGVHPTETGHKRLADKFVEAAKALKL